MENAGKDGKAAREKEAKKERRTDHNPEECPVCMTVFDDTVQRPRTLPCGHTVCTLCINKLQQEGHVGCPECHVSHAVTEGGQFPVSYIAEALIRRKKDSEAAAAASSPPNAGIEKGVTTAAGQKEAAGLSRKMRSFLEEQEASVVTSITACQEVQAQLEQYQTTLRGWGKQQQQQLEDRLQDLLVQSRSASEQVRQEESRAAAKKEGAREWERQLHAALEALRTAETDKEARVAVVEVFRCTDEAEQVLEEYQGSVLPNANTATTVRKVRGASNAVLEALQAALEAFQAVQGALEAHPSVAKVEPTPQLETDCTILTPSLKAEDLCNPTQPVRRLLEAGRVFGVHQVKGQPRHARISLEDGQMYLHTLKEGPLQPGAIALEVSHVVPNFFPCMVFLDLSWPGNAPRRVHVCLSPDTTLGRQAVLLCTGQRGHSYAGTRLFEVNCKGKPGESVRGGDYENNDGTGGAALVHDLHKGEHQRTGKAGAVCGRFSDPERGSQIEIITRTGFFPSPGVFGKVVQGLDTVEAAAKHKPITEVIIENCGVVLCGQWSAPPPPPI